MLISTKPKIFDVDLYGLAAVLLIVATTWLTIIQPLERHLQQQKAEHQGSMQSQSSSQLKLEKLRQLCMERKNVSEQLSHTRDVLRDNTGMAELVGKLEQLTEKNDLLLDNIIPNSIHTTGHFQRKDIDLRITGSFNALRHLLADIALELPYIRLNELSVSNQTDLMVTTSENRSHCNINLHLCVFAPK